MKTILTCSLVVFLSGLLCLKTYSQTEASKVDSVYNLIKGNWYRVYACSGMTGRCDSVSSDNIYNIERIAGTDSIIWKESLNDQIIGTRNYKISYSRSNIYRINIWMLISQYGTKLNIKTIPNGIMFAPDYYDAGEIGYSRKKSTTGIVNPLINTSNLLLFPNPTTGSFAVTGVDNIESINILDINGQLIKTKDCKNSTAFIDISGLPYGIYIVHVVSKGGKYIGKIIKS